MPDFTAVRLLALLGQGAVSRVSAASPVFAHAAGYNMRHGAIAVLLLATADRHAAAEVQKVSTNADGSTEEVNPYESSGDSTLECYTWAADGQCVANPGFMLSSCKYSCFEWFIHRKKKFPDAPIGGRPPDSHSATGAARPALFFCPGL